MKQREAVKSVKKWWVAFGVILSCLLLWLGAKNVFSRPLDGIFFHVEIQGEGNTAAILVNLENASRRPVDIAVPDLPGFPNDLFHGNIISCIHGRYLVGNESNYHGHMLVGVWGAWMWRLHPGESLRWNLPISDLKIYVELIEESPCTTNQDLLWVEIWIATASSPGILRKSVNTLLTSDKIEVPKSVSKYMSEIAVD